MSKTRKINRAKIQATATILLMLAAFAFMSVAFAANGQASGEKKSGEGNMPEMPGIPDNAVQLNKTDVTPNAEMEQVRAGEPALFRYRNTTMLMNCTQNCEVVVTVDPEVKPKLLGVSVEPNQTMTLTMNLSRSPLEGEMVTERTLNFYWGIEPNATLQLRGQLRLHVNQTELSQELNREVNASRLTWMYWNRTQANWEQVPSYIDSNGYLVCNTDHFSTWTVAEMTTQDSNEAVETGLSTVYVYTILAVVAIVGLAVGITIVIRRR
jgi:hypothetical protein